MNNVASLKTTATYCGIYGDGDFGLASFSLDCAALAYGQARLDRNYAALSLLAKELKEAAVRFAETAGLEARR